MALKEDQYVENSLGISSDLSNIASFYKKKGNFKEALFYYKRVLEVNKSLSLTYREISDLKNIIDIFQILGKEDEIKVYEKALKELLHAVSLKSQENSSK